METTTLFGFELLFAVMGLVIGLTLWSRHIIETIHRRKLASLRQIRRGLKNA